MINDMAMEEDRLKKFIALNREAFDDREPDPKGWKVVQAALSNSKAGNFLNSVVFWRAAAILFMAISIYLSLPKSMFLKNETAQLAMNEFKEVEAFYIQEISNKVRLIDELSIAVDDNEFTQDLQQLDAMYAVLKEELKSRPGKKVKDALVLNLLVRINLLNQQLHRLEEEYKEGAEETKAAT